MKRSILILPILFILLFLTPIPARANIPKLFIPVECYDFGEITEGKTVEHAFIIKNTGKVPLEIKSVTPDCNCAKARLSTSRIKAGKEGKIIVTFNSQGQSGSFTKLIIIETNDPVEPVKMIKIKGMVIEKDA